MLIQETQPILTEADRRRLLYDWNGTDLDFPHDLCLHDIFENQAKLTPDSISVLFDSQALSYEELNVRANQLAHYLLALGVKLEDRVGICLERGLDLPVAIIAVLKAGATFVPIDPDSPSSRLEFTLADAGAQFVITKKILLGQLPPCRCGIICLDADEGAIRTHRRDNPGCAVSADNLCAIFYTSGSTGQPKGVMTPHRSPLSRLFSAQTIWGVKNSDRRLLQSGITYASTITQMFMPFIGGAQLVIAAPGTDGDAAYLARLIVETGTTIAGFPPSVLRLVLKELHGAQSPLRCVYCSAEGLPPAIRDLFFETLSAGLHKFYGLTEAPGVAHWQCNPGEKEERQTIGRPTDMKVYLLDRELEPAPIGMAGEIYAGGVSLARGYLNCPDKTAEKFIPDPFSQTPGERLYRTGDLGRWLPERSIEFIGRVDYQVNIGGYRIEPGEIETAISKHPSVQEAAVLMREDKPGEKRLVAYIAPPANQSARISDLRNFLKESLPRHMLPSLFVTMTALPRTPNGKVDRRSLPAPQSSFAVSGKQFIAPKTPTQAKIVTIWAALFDADLVSIQDSFFELGGYSLVAVQLISRLNEAFGINLPLKSLFDAPTPAGLAQIVDRELIENRSAKQAQFSYAIEQTSKPEEPSRLTNINLNINLNMDVLLEPDLHFDAPSAVNEGGPSSLLITGATGYLGAFLLRELIRRTEARIFCLVRGGTADEAFARIERNLKRYNLPADNLKRRVIAVPGDLASPRLGLAERQFESLAREIDLIYHNGALVNYLYPYQAHKTPNVNGTHEILRLAGHRKLKPVHFISTLSIFIGEKSADRDVFYEDDSLDDCGPPYSGYDQSKWVAEKIVRKAIARGLPASIYRPGLILGHSRTGQWNADFASNFIRTCIELRAAPDFDVTVNAVPVDHASKAIVQIAQHSSCAGRTFHISNPHPASGYKILEWMRSIGYQIALMPYADWRIALSRCAATYEKRGLLAYVYLMTEADPNHFAKHRFDCQNTLSELAGSGISCPPLSAELIRLYLSYLARRGFIPRPDPVTNKFKSEAGRL